MFILSGVFNIIAGIVLAWWSFGALNNVILLFPSVVFLIVGCLCIYKAMKQRK